MRVATATNNADSATAILGDMDGSTTTKDPSITEKSETPKASEIPKDPMESWRPFFDACSDVGAPGRGATFRVYEAGAGRAAGGALFVLHHGAGLAAMSWALLARRIATAGGDGEAAVLCVDARGHGSTRADSEQLALATLADDLAAVVNHLYPQPHSKDIILVGHSLGGAVVVDVMSRSLIPGVRGVVVLDVVEGTAVESLPHMRSILRSRPQSFPSPDAAVQWALRNNQVKNAESAKLSVPAQLVQDQTGKWIWRTDLAKTSEHWPGWFDRLSEKFLSARAGKLLILAGTDRLDKTLMIGQMQGKFQMHVYPESGHTIQEDVPDKLTTDLIEFWKRNKPIVAIKRFPIPPLKSDR